MTEREKESRAPQVLLAWSSAPGFTAVAGFLVAEGFWTAIILGALLTHDEPWVRPAWGVFITFQAGAWILMFPSVALPRRVELRQDGIWMWPNGWPVGRTIRWARVKAYQIDPPQTLLLEVQEDIQPWGMNGEVVVVLFPQRRSAEIEAILSSHTG